MPGVGGLCESHETKAFSQFGGAELLAQKYQLTRQVGTARLVV